MYEQLGAPEYKFIELKKICSVPFKLERAKHQFAEPERGLEGNRKMKIIIFG